MFYLELLLLAIFI